MATALDEKVEPKKPLSVIDAIREAPHRFGFFQAVRLLNLWARKSKIGEAAESANDAIYQEVTRKPIGYDYPPLSEIVRFRTLASHSFPASEISRFEPPKLVDDELFPSEMTVTFMGLTGPMGVLPRHYTQAVIDQLGEGGSSLIDFLDLFNHRQISFFYRAWEKYHFAVRYERERSSGNRGDDVFTHGLYSLIGFGTDGIRDRMIPDDETFLFYSGQFSRNTRSVISLERMVHECFGVASRVVQFVGQWLRLDPEDQSSLPTTGFRGRNTAVGISTILGDKVWGVENRFSLQLGPLNYAQFRRYMPAGDLHEELAQFVRTYVGPGYDFDIQPILIKEDVPNLMLTAETDPRLGWNTWVKSQPVKEDVYDASFSAKGNPILSTAQ